MTFTNQVYESDFPGTPDIQQFTDFNDKLRILHIIYTTTPLLKPPNALYIKYVMYLYIYYLPKEGWNILLSRNIKNPDILTFFGFFWRYLVKDALLQLLVLNTYAAKTLEKKALGK